MGAEGGAQDESRSTLSQRDVVVLLLVLLAAFALRLYIALGTAYFWDEERDWLILARGISFVPGHLNLPIRGFHPALPAYFMKTSSLLFGANHFGYRLPGLIAGILSIWVAVRLALDWFGAKAAHVTAVILASNEYHVQISTIAVEKIYYLTFAAFAFSTLEGNHGWPTRGSWPIAGRRSRVPCPSGCRIHRRAPRKDRPRLPGLRLPIPERLSAPARFRSCRAPRLGRRGRVPRQTIPAAALVNQR